MDCTTPGLPDDRLTDVLPEYTITCDDWIYTKDRYGDWRGTHVRGRKRTRLKGTLAWAKQDASSGRLQHRNAEGGWVDAIVR